MGYFYSLGINFDRKEDAEICNKKFKNFEIILSDNTVIEKFVSLYEEKHIDGKLKFQSQIWPKGLQYAIGDKKLASKPYFYEIRNILYYFLQHFEMDFNYAFFEFEGADHFLDDNIIDTLNEFGIGEITKGDSNAATLCNFDSEYYNSKRFYDGLILNNSLFKNLNDKSFFVEFKKGYMWLPLNEY